MAFPDFKTKFMKLSEIIDFLRQTKDANEKELNLLISAHVFRASLLANIGKEKEALNELNFAEKYEIDDPRLDFEKGRVLVALKQYPLGIRHLTKAISSFPSGSPIVVTALFFRAKAYYEIYVKLFAEKSDSQERKEHFTKASQDINECLFYDPNYILARFEKARIYALENPKTAIEEYKSLLEASKEKEQKAEAHFRLSILYYQDDNAVEGQNHYVLLSKLEPDSVRTLSLKQMIEKTEEQKQALTASMLNKKKEDDIKQKGFSKILEAVKDLPPEEREAEMRKRMTEVFRKLKK